MGFFKKVFKGVGKVFKKIGRGIKKVASKVGKFMNKIGIVGQIAMAFILPGIGNMLMQGIGGIASSMVANTLGGIGGAIVKGAGHVVRAAHKFVTVGKNAFNTVSQGITKFVGEFGKTALNKIPGINIESASKNFFGKGGAWESVQNDIVKNASRITDPFKRSITVTKDMTIDDIMNSTGLPKEAIQQTNIGLDLDRLSPGDVVNFDPDAFGSTMAGQGPLRPELQSFTGNVADRVPTMKAESLFTEGQIQQGTFQQRVDKALQPMSSLLSPETTVPVDTSRTLFEAAKDEVTGRYNFADAPIASTFKAAQDIGTAQQLIDPEAPEYYGSDAIPMYVNTQGQYMAAMSQSVPRNFAAYANLGQHGSTANLYDTILMNPVSTWARDLASRTS